ncbi:uncharacterized protein LOC133192407 [Saccostrea echinata]|uniref:uncharacterized protein LOC133192407 n=1 Tax=Saccostrea echinata TaxID=191078 RepID=UPI002A7FC95F|nr:uncharacterized protein LOC133192407 [Saccostrea echinata]
MASEIGISPRVQLNTCADCGEPAVCTCSLCDTKMHMCIKHMNIHMDTVHMLSENTKCSLHLKNSLKCFCRSCCLPLCDKCVIDGGHVSHKRSELATVLEFLKEAISNENRELITHIKPFYQNILDTTEEKLKEVPLIYDKAKKAIKNFGDFLHKVIDNAVDSMHTKLDEKEKKDMRELQNQKDFYSKKFQKLDDTLLHNKMLLGSKNAAEVADFSSSLAYFHLNPSQVKLELPYYKPNTNNQEIQEKCLELFGKILHTSDKNFVPNFKLNNAKDIEMQLLEKPGILKILWKSRFPPDSLDQKLYSLSCINPETVLIGGNDCMLFKRALNYNDSQHLQPFKITSKGFYFALSSTGAIFFSDKNDRSVKRIKKRKSNKISTFLEFHPWEPKGITMTPYDHVLICLYRKKHSKVVQYAQTGNIVQEIQYTNEKLLYEHPMFICCNKNGDICTADYKKRAVIVVDQFGVFRFSYNGHTLPESGKTFTPCNMATDDLCNIAITDFENHKIHLLDKYGQFLRFLNPDAEIRHPRAIAIDKKGKMWLGEGKTGHIKVLQYLK